MSWSFFVFVSHYNPLSSKLAHLPSPPFFLIPLQQPTPHQTTSNHTPHHPDATDTRAQQTTTGFIVIVTYLCLSLSFLCVTVISRWWLVGGTCWWLVCVMGLVVLPAPPLLLGILAVLGGPVARLGTPLCPSGLSGRSVRITPPLSGFVSGGNPVLGLPPWPDTAITT